MRSLGANMFIHRSPRATKGFCSRLRFRCNFGAASSTWAPLDSTQGCYPQGTSYTLKILKNVWRTWSKHNKKSPDISQSHFQICSVDTDTPLNHDIYQNSIPKEEFGTSFCQAVCTPPETVTDRAERVARLAPLVARHTVAPSEAMDVARGGYWGRHWWAAKMFSNDCQSVFGLWPIDTVTCIETSKFGAGLEFLARGVCQNWQSWPAFSDAFYGHFC